LQRSRGLGFAEKQRVSVGGLDKIQSAGLLGRRELNSKIALSPYVSAAEKSLKS
jgi:hypothetical protein